MAKPIPETPVLYDEDAYRFEMAAHNVKPLPKAAQKRIKEAYDKLSKIFSMGIDVAELRRRGYEEESIRLMLRMEFERNFIDESPDFDEDPQGWLDAHV